MLWTIFIISKISKGSNSVSTGDRVMNFALLNFLYAPLSVYQVSFSSFVYFQRYAPYKFFMTKIKKGSSSVNTGGRLMDLT